MDKTLLAKVKEAKKGHEKAYVIFFNDREPETETYEWAYRIKEAKDRNSVSLIQDVLVNGTVWYAHDDLDFDQVDMNLSLGLVYEAKDVDENNNIKENAEPVYDVVRFYTGEVNCFQNGKKQNKLQYSRFGMGRQSYCSYNDLVEKVTDNEISFDGPQSFEEFKKAVLAGEKFDIRLTANLKEEEKDQETQKEEEPRLVRRSFFRRG